MTVASIARVSTTVPRRYLGQLCKHFEHKRPVTCAADNAEGRIEFEIGTCTLDAGADTLNLHAEAPDAERLERLQDVVARHLLRFAFREPPEIVWHAVQPAAE